MIISVSEFVGENTSTINRLSSILNRAATNDFRMVSITAAKDAFDGAARNGIDVSPDKSGKEVLRPNPTLFAEVGRLLDKAIADVTAVAQDLAKVVVTSAVQEICPNLKSTSLMRDFPSLADGLTGSFHVKMLAGLMDVVRASATA